MKRGPKPKPTTLKLLAGVRPERINLDEPPAPPGRPDPPDHLDNLALKGWNEIVPLLEKMKVLTQADGASLALYAVHYSTWFRARADIAKRGMIVETRHSRRNKQGAVVDEFTIVKMNPSIHAMNAAASAMQRILQEFGLTPSSRSRIRVEPGKKTDKLSTFLAKRGG